MTNPVTQTPIAVPPIPLLSGGAFIAADGVTRPVAEVAVVVTAADGTEQRIVLTARFGGWWAPPLA